MEQVTVISTNDPDAQLIQRSVSPMPRLLPKKEVIEADFDVGVFDDADADGQRDDVEGAMATYRLSHASCARSMTSERHEDDRKQASSGDPTGFDPTAMAATARIEQRSGRVHRP